VTVAGDILREGADLVDGARPDTHGDKSRSFEMIASLWSAYLEHPVTAADVGWMMAMLKGARAKCGKPVRDHYTDGAAYVAIAGELSGAE
jgi:hypothetical protein